MAIFNLIVGDSGSGMDITYDASEIMYTATLIGSAFPTIMGDVPLGVLRTHNGSIDFSYGCTLEIKPIDGYELISAVSISGKEYDVTNNSLSIILKRMAYSRGGKLGLVVKAQAIGGGGEDGGSVINEYITDLDGFNNFKNLMYGVVNYENTVESDKLNITNFLISSRLLPFKPDDIDYSILDNILVREQILGEATKIDKDYIGVNLGDFTVPKTYDNSLDIIDVDVELYVPFLDSSINIPSNKVIGRTINIMMYVVISTGDSTINISYYDGEENIIFSINGGNVGLSIPFYNSYDIKNTDLNISQSINNINKAYLLVDKPIYNNSIVMTNVKGDLIGVNGLVKVNTSNLDVNCAGYEKEQIENLLSSGVIIL